MASGLTTMVIPFPADPAQRMEPDRESFQHWLTLAKRGDLPAFERILQQFDAMVLRTAQRLLGNASDAQDAAQEVFLRLHRSLATFEEDREFAPWLYRVTVNVCHDHLRSRNRARTSPLECIADHAEGAPDPEQLASREQEKRRIYAALATLPEKERAALVLRDLEGLPTADVAAILGSSEATVRSQISSARVKLRRALQPERNR